MQIWSPRYWFSNQIWGLLALRGFSVSRQARQPINQAQRLWSAGRPKLPISPSSFPRVNSPSPQPNSHIPKHKSNSVGDWKCKTNATQMPMFDYADGSGQEHGGARLTHSAHNRTIGGTQANTDATFTGQCCSLTSVMCVCVLTKSGHITHADTTPLSHRHTGRIKRRCARFICRSKAGVWLHQCIIAWCFWSTLILTRQPFSNLRWQVYPSFTSFKDGKGKKSSDSFVVHLVWGLWAGPLTCQLCSHTCLMFADMSVCSMQMTGDQSSHTEVFWGSCHVCFCNQRSNDQQPVATNCHLLGAGGCHGVADLSLGLCEWSLTIIAFPKWNCMWKCSCLTCILNGLYPACSSV